MAKLVTKSKKPRVSRAELAAIKSTLIDELQGAYGELQKFCTGRPPWE